MEAILKGQGNFRKIKLSNMPFCCFYGFMKLKRMFITTVNPTRRKN